MLGAHGDRMDLPDFLLVRTDLSHTLQVHQRLADIEGAHGDARRSFLGNLQLLVNVLLLARRRADEHSTHLRDLHNIGANCHLFTVSTHCSLYKCLQVFLLVAKGWSITRYRITAEDWRVVIILISLFYMSLSIILVLENNVLDRRGFWIAIAVIYGLMYYFIFVNVMRQLRRLTLQVSLLESSMPSAIVGPLIEKYRMYVALLFLMFCAMSIEIVCNTIIAEKGTLWQTLAVYEVSNVLIFLGIGIIFRPRVYSPFFFMVPARMDDARTRTIATIEATDEDCDAAEVELAPLLIYDEPSSGSRRRIAPIPSSMILIRNPDKAVSVGISSMMNSRPTGAREAGAPPGQPPLPGRPGDASREIEDRP